MLRQLVLEAAYITAIGTFASFGIIDLIIAIGAEIGAFLVM